MNIHLTKMGPLNENENEKVRKQIKENEAPGSDGITSEVLKRCEVKVLCYLQNEKIGVVVVQN